MVSNMLAWWVTSISIWDLEMSGWFVIHSAWSASMDGKETIGIGELTPLAMTVSGLIAMDTFNPGVTSRQRPPRRRKWRKSIEWRSRLNVLAGKFIQIRHGVNTP
jgi:hypothetical protein